MSFKQAYLAGLSIILPSTTTLGLWAGVFGNETNPPKQFFSKLFSYSMIGAAAGLSYPVLFPLLGGYIIYKRS